MAVAATPLTSTNARPSRHDLPSTPSVIIWADDRQRRSSNDTKRSTRARHSPRRYRSSSVLSRRFRGENGASGRVGTHMVPALERQCWLLRRVDSDPVQHRLPVMSVTDEGSQALRVECGRAVMGRVEGVDAHVAELAREYGVSWTTGYKWRPCSAHTTLGPLPKQNDAKGRRAIPQFGRCRPAPASSSCLTSWLERGHHAPYHSHFPHGARTTRPSGKFPADCG